MISMKILMQYEKNIDEKYQIVPVLYHHSDLSKCTDDIKKMCRCPASSSNNRQVKALQVYWKIDPEFIVDHAYAIIYFIKIEF